MITKESYQNTGTLSPPAAPGATLWKNVRAARGWRMQDMVNWHRLVKPLGQTAPRPKDIDLFPLLYDFCTRFEVEYRPSRARPQNGPQIPRPTSADDFHVAHFIDNPEHLSGVATTVGSWVKEAQAQGKRLTVHTCGSQAPDWAGVRFAPMGTLLLHNYQGMALPVPKVSEVQDYLQHAPMSAVHVSTPGPMGMLGLLTARSRGLPLVGTYHTDFPRYAATLCDHPAAEEGAWRLMHWFYGQLDRVAAPTASIRNDLVAHGFNGDRIEVVGRGVSLDRFHPSLRCEAFRQARWGDGTRKVLLYVGRVSSEKNLDVLAYAFQQLSQRDPSVDLVIVGDGPYRTTLEAKLQGFPAYFMGVQKGEALSRIYASADLFVFPSLTDTFGVVLLEAQASGLPVLVGNSGGPRDTIAPGRTGLIVDPMHPEELARQIEGLLRQPQKLQEMRIAAREWAAQFTPLRSFESYWNLHQSPPPHREPCPL